MIFSPDALTGAILTFEGIRDAAVLLNGPTGCKLYHSFLSDRQFPRTVSHDPLAFQGEFYFGQPRVPCTYLDGEDYIEGSLEKLERALLAVAAKEKGLLAVINSPGASLIGDDLQRILEKTGFGKRCLALENTGFSLPASQGFEKAGLALLEKLELRPLPRRKNRVNILGLSLLHKHPKGTVEELERLLSLLGLEVGAVLFADTALEDIRESSGAACNVVLFPEYGTKIADWYSERFGIPMALSPLGAPVGFEATEAFIREIAKTLDIDPTPALEAIRKGRKQSYRKLARFHSFTGLPGGASFSIMAESSFAYPLTCFLYSYLGMVPLAVKTLPGGDSVSENALQAFLEEKGFSGAWGQDPALEMADIAFDDGYTIGLLKETGHCKTGIEIALPTEGYLHFVPKTYLGIAGTFQLLEEIINGLRSSS